MLLFFAIYAIFGCVLTLTAFFARTQTIDLKISFKDALKAVLLCFFEITFLRFIMAFVRATAFFKYKKKKTLFGVIFLFLKLFSIFFISFSIIFFNSVLI